MRWQLHQATDLTATEKSAVQTLSLAVYPPETAAAWPGRGLEWAVHQWCVIGWDAGGEALCYVGVLLRQARWNERAVKVGGIGGVKTHPAARDRGLATTGIRRALGFFQEQRVDFGLLVCEPALIAFYERLGWGSFPGEVFVTRKQARVPFTFNVPMTTPIMLQESLSGCLDLLGPTW